MIPHSPILIILVASCIRSAFYLTMSGIFRCSQQSEKILTSKASLEHIIESYKLLRMFEDFSFYLVAYLMVVPPPPPTKRYFFLLCLVPNTWQGMLGLAPSSDKFVREKHYTVKKVSDIPASQPGCHSLGGNN